jgi:hypothetical protein
VAAKQPAKKHDDLMNYVDLWNKERGPLPKVLRLTKKRERLLAARIAEGLTRQQFKEIMAKIHAAPFLLGDNDRGWRVDFDFVIANDTNIQKILEGGYDRASKPKPVRREMPNIGETRDTHAR